MTRAVSSRRGHDRRRAYLALSLLALSLPALAACGDKSRDKSCVALCAKQARCEEASAEASARAGRGAATASASAAAPIASVSGDFDAMCAQICRGVAADAASERRARCLSEACGGPFERCLEAASH